MASARATQQWLARLGVYSQICREIVYIIIIQEQNKNNYNWIMRWCSDDDGDT